MLQLLICVDVLARSLVSSRLVGGVPNALPNAGLLAGRPRRIATLPFGVFGGLSRTSGTPQPARNLDAHLFGGTEAVP